MKNKIFKSPIVISVNVCSVLKNTYEGKIWHRQSFVFP